MKVKDVLLTYEVLEKSVLVHKPGSQKRGQVRENIADTLNSLNEFHVTS